MLATWRGVVRGPHLRSAFAAELAMGGAQRASARDRRRIDLAVLAIAPRARISSSAVVAADINVDRSRQHHGASSSIVSKNWLTYSAFPDVRTPSSPSARVSTASIARFRSRCRTTRSFSWSRSSTLGMLTAGTRAHAVKGIRTPLFQRSAGIRGGGASSESVVGGSVSEQFGGEDCHDTWFDTDDALGRQCPQCTVDRDATRPDRFGQPLLRARQHDGSGGRPAGRAQQPRCGTGRGIGEAGAYQIVLLVAEIAGEVDQDVAACGRDVVNGGQQIVGR